MTKLTQTEILQRVLDCKRKLGLDTLPTAVQVKQYAGMDWVILKRIGGLKGISSMTGIPLVRPQRHAKTDENGEYTSGRKPRPSRADKIEAEMRKIGLHYSDWQKVGTLKREEGKAW